MRLPASLAIIPALVLCGAGFCQRANSQTKPAKKAEATVSGKVTIKGKPAPGIVVGMRSSQPSQFDPTFKATTDQEGSYQIADVPAGSYEVMPVAPAMVISDANSFRGKQVVVNDDEHVEGIDFELVRGGVITGKIVDAGGHPLIEERVNLIPFDQRSQRGPVYSLMTGFQTDDRGIYRMFGIRPGRYRVSVGEGDDNFYGRFGRTRPTYRSTFYPGVNDAAKATVIDVDEGTEATRIDITVGPVVEGFAVNGRVVDESGKPVANVSIGLSRITADGNSSGGGNAGRTDSLGEFRVEKLPVGKYSVSFFPPPDSDLRADQVSFDVLDQDVTGLVIKASSGASVSGVVVVEGARDNTAVAMLAESYIAAYLRSDDQKISSGRAARLKPDGSFRVSGLLSGTASISFDSMGHGKGFTISRIERDGVIQPNGIQIRTGEQVTGIRVIIAYSNGSIRGAVKLENGTLPSGGRLLIYLTKPGDPSWSGPTPNADARGHFLIEGLPAGIYELRVIAYVPGLRTKEGTKQIVTVTDGTATEVTITVDLTPTPNP